MATFIPRISYVANENRILNGKVKPQPDVKRAALKEVGNKILAQPRGKGLTQNISIPEKKPVPLPSVKFPIVKTLAKQPSIQVKETRACRLRTQHSRQSIGKEPEKKNVLVNAKVKEENIIANEKVKDKSVNDEREKENSLQKTFSKPPLQTISAFSSTLLSCAYIIDIDKEDENDPVMLGMYAKDMYKYLREMEIKFPILPQYLQDSRITGKMRATLIDWLVEVQKDFEMNIETLFLTVAIIDRFLQKSLKTSRNQLQLVGLTAMFVASKYEEIQLPAIEELVYVSDNAYNKKEILNMELTLVKTLDCSFGRPLPIHFLRRYSKADRVAPIAHVMAKYFLELGVQEYDLCHVAPSLLAAAALYMSLWLFKRKINVWSHSLVQYSNYSEKQILPVVEKLASVVLHAASSKFQAIRKKYALPKNLQVSEYPTLEKLTELVL